MKLYITPRQWQYKEEKIKNLPVKAYSSASWNLVGVVDDKTRNTKFFPVTGSIHCCLYKTRVGRTEYHNFAYVGKWLIYKDNLADFGYSFRNGVNVSVLAERISGSLVRIVQRLDNDLRILSDMRNKPAWQKMPWLDPSIDAIYAERDEITKRTGVPHEVDHIHPVVHPRLCGLTVPWNLQIISATENRRKGNRLESI